MWLSDIVQYHCYKGLGRAECLKFLSCSSLRHEESLLIHLPVCAYCCVEAMEGVMERAAALCVCKLACSLLFLPSLAASHSAISFCCCCLLIFTDFAVTGECRGANMCTGDQHLQRIKCALSVSSVSFTRTHVLISYFNFFFS